MSDDKNIVVESTFHFTVVLCYPLSHFEGTPPLFDTIFPFFDIPLPLHHMCVHIAFIFI